MKTISLILSVFLMFTTAFLIGCNSNNSNCDCAEVCACGDVCSCDANCDCDGCKV